VVARRRRWRRNPARLLRIFNEYLNHVAKQSALLIYQLVDFIDAKFRLPGSYSGTKISQGNVACQGRRPTGAIAAKESGWTHRDSMPCQECVEETNIWHGDGSRGCITPCSPHHPQQQSESNFSNERYAANNQGSPIQSSEIKKRVSAIK
jgi:hypothetical protein